LPEDLEPASKATATTVRDIPQGKYIDIASSILGVEPEYLFDPPSTVWLVRWYYSCLVLMSASGFSAYCIAYCSRSKKEARTNVLLARNLFWFLAFVAGALGTTILSRWTEEFYFTWPLCLYIVWDIAISKISKRSTIRNWWNRAQSSLMALSFMGMFLLYIYVDV
jgi:hypothetical protein